MTISSNFTPSVFSSYSKPKTEESANAVAEKVAKKEENVNFNIEKQQKKETPTVAAERGKIIQKTSKDIESELSYSTYNMKKQSDEQSYLLSDSPERVRHDFLGKNLSILV